MTVVTMTMGRVKAYSTSCQVEVGEEEEQHEAGHEEPAVDELSAAGQHLETGHQGDHTKHDAGFGQDLEEDME